MNFIETLVAITILTFFCFSFTQSYVSLLSMTAKANAAYSSAKSMEFIDRSFRNTCSSATHDLEKWKMDVRIINGLESCEVTELKKNGSLCAMKAVCVVNSERIEIISEYTNP